MRQLLVVTALLGLTSACKGDAVKVMGRGFDMPHQAAWLQLFSGDVDGDGEKDDGVAELAIVGTTFDDPCAVLTSGPPLEGWGQLLTIHVGVRALDVDWDAGLLQVGETYTYDDELDNQVIARAIELEAGETLFEAGMPPNARLTIDALDDARVALTFDGAWTWSNEVGGERVTADPPEPVLLELDLELCVIEPEA